MLISFQDIKIGDEIIIPSNSNLKYLKVVRLGKKSHACSLQRGVDRDGILSSSWNENTCQSDISKHNNTFYLKDDSDYRDIWLVRREDND